MSEEQAIVKIREGDIKAFEKVFKGYYQMLCEYACSFTKDSDFAEELVQEVFYNLWKNHATISIQSTLKGYLYQSVKNEFLQFVRHRKVEQKYADRYRNEMTDPSYFPADEVVANELSEKIDRTLQSLPEKCREIFTLSRYEGLKYHEIAEKLSISVKTVEAYMTKALKVFRKELNEKER